MLKILHNICHRNNRSSLFIGFGRYMRYAIVPAWQGLHSYKVKQTVLTDWQLSRNIVLVHQRLPDKALGLVLYKSNNLI